MILIELVLLIIGIVGLLGLGLLVYKLRPVVVRKLQERREKQAERAAAKQAARLENIVAVSTRVGLTSQDCAKCGRRFNSWYDFERGYRTCPRCESVNYLLSEMVVATKSHIKPTFHEALQWKRNK